MTLTVGTGPFGQSPAGVFNDAVTVDGRVIWWEDSPRWVRGLLDDETVVDSRRVKLLHESGLLPRWYFPREDVREDLLEASDRHTHCPIKGDASYFSVRVGERVAENAAWTYPEPIEGSPPLQDHLSFAFAALDQWLEEDEPVLGHPRDPYHRLDVRTTSRHVRVSVAGRRVADSTRAVVLFETGLPPRWYLPREDVDASLLRPDETTSVCAYKGIASYHAVEVDGHREEGIAWFYPEPEPEVAPIADRICFLDEHVDVEIDGVPQERPRSPFSRR